MGVATRVRCRLRHLRQHQPPSLQRVEEFPREALHLSAFLLCEFGAGPREVEVVEACQLHPNTARRFGEIVSTIHFVRTNSDLSLRPFLKANLALYANTRD